MPYSGASRISEDNVHIIQTKGRDSQSSLQCSHVRQGQSLARMAVAG